MAFEYGVRGWGKEWAVTMGRSGLILETQPSEELAEIARHEYAAGEREAPSRHEVWLIAESFISEPWLGGMQIGEARELDIRHFEVVRRLSQDEFDGEIQEYHEEHGHYPDT